MTYCTNCGTQTPGQFCPNCGANVAQQPSSATGAASGTPPPFTAPPPYGVPPQYAATSTGGLAPNIAAALCYAPFGIGFICEIVFLVAEPYKRTPLVRFHAFQGLFFHLAVFLFWIALGIISIPLLVMTHGAGLALHPLFGLAITVLTVVLVVKAYQSEQFRLPVIGDLAAKQV